MLEAKVSIIITTYKGSECIDRAIGSLLNQTYKNLEIIVVDDNNDNSVDRIETEKKMQKYLNNPIVKYIKHERNLNGAVARNNGIKASEGEFIAFLDDDDYYLPQRVEKSMQALLNHKEAEAVFTGVIITDNKYITRIVTPSFENDLCKELMFNVNMVGTGSNLFLRKSAIMDINGFDESFTRLQDVEFLLRFFEKYKVCCIEDILIIKMQSSVDNLPKYEKLRDIKYKFYNKFKSFIENLSEDERERYFASEYGRLLQSCFGIEGNRNINNAIKELTRYRKLTYKEQMCIMMSRIGVPHYNVYLVVRRILSKLIKPIKDKKYRKKYNISYKFNKLTDIKKDIF